MVQIATNTPSGLGRRSLSLSREARALSMSREAVSNLNQCRRVGTDCDGAVSCGSKTLPWTAGMRKKRALLPDGLANGTNLPLCYRSRSLRYGRTAPIAARARSRDDNRSAQSLGRSASA